MDGIRTLLAKGLGALVEADGRMASLDGVRAFAIAAVLLCHTTLLPGGYVGVEVFFVLSGYLITGILLRERERAGRIDLGRFYWRRALRLMPALAFVLAIGSAYDFARFHSLHSTSFTALPY